MTRDPTAKRPGDDVRPSFILLMLLCCRWDPQSETFTYTVTQFGGQCGRTHLTCWVTAAVFDCLWQLTAARRLSFWLTSTTGRMQRDNCHKTTDFERWQPGPLDHASISSSAVVRHSNRFWTLATWTTRPSVAVLWSDTATDFEHWQPGPLDHQ